MKILVDSDWILELLVNRYQYRKEAKKLLTMLNERSPTQVYITELCSDKISSFLGKKDPQLGQEAVLWVKDLFNNRILPFSNDVRDYASNLPIKDFESAVEVAIAKKENIGAIITLNPEIFTGANLPILSAHSFLERIQLEQTFEKNNCIFLVEGNQKIIDKLNNLLQIEAPAPDKLSATNNLESYVNTNSISDNKIYFEKGNIIIKTYNEDVIITPEQIETIIYGSLKIAKSIADILKKVSA